MTRPPVKVRRLARLRGFTTLCSLVDLRGFRPSRRSAEGRRFAARPWFAAAPRSAAGRWSAAIAVTVVVAIISSCAPKPPTAEDLRALAHQRFEAIAETMAANKPEGWTDAGHRYLDDYFDEIDRLEGLADPDPAAALAHALLRLETDFDRGSLDYADYPVLEPVLEPLP